MSTPVRTPRCRPFGVVGNAGALLRLSILLELRNVGPEVVSLFLVLDAGKYHLGAGNLGVGLLDVFEERLLAPRDAGVLVGIRIGIALGGSGLATVQPVEFWTDLVLGAFADRVASEALVERG